MTHSKKAMPKLDHILVCVDGSEAGFHALTEAIELAQWTKAGVTVMTVTLFFEGDLNLTGVKNIKDTLAGPSESVLTEAMRIARSRHAEIRIVCEEGHPGDKILACAESQKADLIVTGADPSMPRSSFILESTLRYLIKNSTRDLLIVPNATKFRGDDFMAVFEKDGSSPDLLSKAVDFLSRFGGEKIIASIPSDGRSDPAPEDGSNLKRTSSGGYPTLYHQDHRDILRHATHHNVSLMIFEKGSRFGKWRFMKSLKLEKLVRSAPCPVMILPAP